MPNIKSAAKRLRSDAKKNLVNRMRKSRVHTAEKNLVKDLEGDKANVPALLSKYYSELDKAAKKGVIHKNKANRKKQRLALKVAKAVNA